MTSHVDKQIADRIATARARRALRRQQRAELDANRQHGLTARHLAKMTRWEAEDAT